MAILEAMLVWSSREYFSDRLISVERAKFVRRLNAGVGIKRLVVGDFGEVVVEVDGVLAGGRKTIVDKPFLQIPSGLVFAVYPEQEPRPSRIFKPEEQIDRL